MRKRYEAITADCNILDHKTQDYLDSEQVATLLNEREELEAEVKRLREVMTKQAERCRDILSNHWFANKLDRNLLASIVTNLESEAHDE